MQISRRPMAWFNRAAATAESHETISREIIAAWLQQALLPGVLEELIFRGALFALLLRIQGRTSAIFVSALLFGALHPGIHHAALATLLGLQLGLLRAVLGLPLAVAAHVTNNSLIFLAAALAAGTSQLPFSTYAADSTLGVFLLPLAMTLSFLSCASLVQSARSEFGPQAPSRSGLQTRAPSDD